MTHPYALAAAAAAADDQDTVDAIAVGQWIGAALTLILTAALVIGVRWALRQRDPLQYATDPGVRTRVRLGQRIAMTAVILIGFAIAAEQLGVLNSIARTVLAGSAITAIIVGFAARATLANALAGIVLTVTQPVRVGDIVRIGEHEGTVEDVTLTATVLKTVHGTTIRIPNEQMAQSVVYNETIDGGGVLPEAFVLLPFGTPMGDAVNLARDVPGVDVARHAGIETDGWNRLAVRGERCAPGDRVPTEARLRLALTEALMHAGFIPRAGLGQEPTPHP